MIGIDHAPTLPMEGTLPPDLQGMLLRVGPATTAGRAAEARPVPGTEEGGSPDVDAAEPHRGALHAVELRDGKAVSYVARQSPADAGVLWHAGSVLALPERGLPSRYSRRLEPLEFSGGLRVPIASHVPRDGSDGARVLFTVDDTEAEEHGVVLRLGEWEPTGALRRAQQVGLERATWQHDIGVSASYLVVVESPTARLEVGPDATAPVPFGWQPGAEMRLGLVRRDGTAPVRWIRLEPCLVTHVLGAVDLEGTSRRAARDGNDEAGGEVELIVCRYEAPEAGQPVDRTASVVGPAGIGLAPIGGGLAVLERWRTSGSTVERTQLDDRHVEYPRLDALCVGGTFRHGYCVETAWDTTGRGVEPVGLLKVDRGADQVTSWRPEPGRRPAEPLFVRARDGNGDDEGWLLTVVDDPDRGASDLYVLDASELGRRRPEAVIHLPARLPLRSHGEWVPADDYR